MRCEGLDTRCEVRRVICDLWSARERYEGEV